MLDKSAYYQIGNLYKINYRGIGGIDIIPTHQLRENQIRVACATPKQEVNIVGKVRKEDIVGCWDKNNIFQPNPNYNKEDVSSNEPVFPKKLKRLFA